MQDEKMVAEYLVESLKDSLDDLEDKYGQLNREYRQRYRECDLLHRNHKHIANEYQILQQSVKSKCELIENNGLTISNHLDQNKFNNHHPHHHHHLEFNGLNDKQHHLYINDSFNIQTNNTFSSTAALLKLSNQNNHQHNHKQTNEIKQVNGYHRPEPISNKNLNNAKQQINNRCNGQLTDEPLANGYIKNSSELTNGHISKTSLPNGLNSSFNNSSNHHSHLSSSTANNKDKRYANDLSSCSSLSSSNDKTSCSSASLIFSEELYQLLSYIEGKTLNEKINFLLHDKISKLQKIKTLKCSLDDEKIKSIKLESLSLINGKHINSDLHKRINSSEDKLKTIDNYKSELELLSKQMDHLSETKSQIDNDILQLKTRLQTMEDTENELKTEKRKLLREFRESQAKIEELDTENYHLRKRIDKLSKTTKISSNNFD